MKAITYNRYCTPPELSIETVPTPPIKSNEVLVQVKAASINQMDVKIASGAFKFITGSKFPKYLGVDFSGEIVSVGQSVKVFQIGDRVCGYMVNVTGSSGTFAEYLAIKASAIVKTPITQPHTTIAAVPCVYLTFDF